MKSVIILTEAGKGIGFGHLTRCSALAEQLKVEGEDTELIVHLKQFDLTHSKFTQLDWLSQSPEKLLAGAAIAVFDSYLVTEDWLRKARTLDCKLVHIDDYNRIRYPVDLIINPNMFAHDLDYSNQDARWVGGSDYVMIRAPFREGNVEIRETNNLCLFITMGGSDYRNMLPKLAKWAQNHRQYDIRIVSPDRTKIRIPGITVLPLLSAEEMSDEMRRADVVISASGQTLNELAYLRKPTIGICVDEDQEPNHHFYNQVGFIRGNLVWNHDDLKKKVERELSRLSNVDERKKACQQFVRISPNGVKNIAETIMSIKHDLF